MMQTNEIPPPRPLTPPLQLASSRVTVSALVTQEKLDDLTRRINAIYRRGTLEVACAVGELVILELFEGSVETWGRDGTRRASYRELAARGDLLLSPSALCRAVAVYTLCKRLGGRSNWRNLTASHLQEVLALDAPQQERLLQEADTEHWSVSRLRVEVNKHRPQSRRTRQRRLVQAVRELTTFLSKRQDALNVETLHEIDDATVEQLRDAVRQLSARLGALERLYGRSGADLR